MYEQFIVTYSAEYEVWAESKEQAIAKGIELHFENPEGEFEAVRWVTE